MRERSNILDPLTSFLIVLCFFHVSEFSLAVCYMRQDLSARCTLLNSSANVVPRLIAVLATALSFTKCSCSLAHQQAILHSYVLCHRRVCA